MVQNKLFNGALLEADANLIASFLLIYDPVHTYRDVTHPPKQITNTKGKIILVKDGMLDYG